MASRALPLRAPLPSHRGFAAEPRSLSLLRLRRGVAAQGGPTPGPPLPWLCSGRGIWAVLGGVARGYAMLSAAGVTRAVVLSLSPSPFPLSPSPGLAASELAGFALPCEQRTGGTLSKNCQSCLVWGEAVSGFGILPLPGTQGTQLPPPPGFRWGLMPRVGLLVKTKDWTQLMTRGRSFQADGRALPLFLPLLDVIFPFAWMMLHPSLAECF